MNKIREKLKLFSPSKRKSKFSATSERIRILREKIRRQMFKRSEISQKRKGITLWNLKFAKQPANWLESHLRENLGFSRGRIAKFARESLNLLDNRKICERLVENCCLSAPVREKSRRNAVKSKRNLEIMCFWRAASKLTSI